MAQVSSGDHLYIACKLFTCADGYKKGRAVLKGLCSATFCGLVASTAAISTAIDSNAQSPPPINIPLTMWQTQAGTNKANIDVGIGNLGPLSFGLDTGSTGLHAFAAAKLDAPNSGVQCTHIPISFTVGNPGTITFSGVICNAPLHIGGLTTPPVPIAYLTSAACTSTNPNCKLPCLNDPNALGGYGVFGVGIIGAMPIPNPLFPLPAPYNSTYSIVLSSARVSGQLVLGGLQTPTAAPAVEFPLTPGKSPAAGPSEMWTFGKACLFVHEQAIEVCLPISFDTGNGVPWIRATDTASIPQSGGIVLPPTQIGFAPVGATAQTFAFVAGKSFASQIKVSTVSSSIEALTNVSIDAFLDHIVTYDNVHGKIYLAPIE